MLQYGFYAWSWSFGGRLLGKFGYGPEYEVSNIPLEWDGGDS